MTIKLKISILILTFITFGLPPILAQDIHEKHDIYKERFYKHFIVNDRTRAGCVNDGIGLMLSQDSTRCQFRVEGYGLPATNLYISPNGAGIPGYRANGRFDHDCSNFGVSWFIDSDDLRKKPKHRFNWLDFSSETLTQSGWMFVFLATEYEIARQNGDRIAQKEALENIFLGLQAIRRLDMQTQHLVDRTYAKRKGGRLLCDKNQVNATRFGWWNNCHRNWDARVRKQPKFKPDFSGYNGFMVRCDAGQNLENILHDRTDESWNVDVIGGAWAGFNSIPLEACAPVDSLCYLAKEQHFISHDQIINLLYGFLFIKKFIPANATIKNCKKQTYHPVKIMQEISNGFINNIKSNHLVLPGSKEACTQSVKLSECEGGIVSTTMYGLIKTNEILQDSVFATKGYRRMLFRMMPKLSGGFNGDFYYKQIAGFRDLSNLSRRRIRLIKKIDKEWKKEILLIGNDLLFPKGKPMADLVGGQQFYFDFLNSAPTDGPCYDLANKESWPVAGSGGDRFWPRGFNCANIKNWEGNRWSYNDWDENGKIKGWHPPSRSNGLDYLALYNIYILRYGKKQKAMN